MSRSVHLDQDDDDDGGGDKEVDQAEKEEAAQALRAEQAVLANRGTAIMCLMYLSASNGEASEMVAETLQLGIHLLSGGNKEIQKVILTVIKNILTLILISDDAQLSPIEKGRPILHFPFWTDEQVQCAQPGNV